MSYLKNKLIEKQNKYLRRKQRVNAQVKLSSPEYRVVVSRSNLYVKADLVTRDGKTLATCSDKGVSGATKTERAKNAGSAFASTLKSKGIEKAAFDRNGYLYHGRVKAFAEGLRE
ncbi:MAG: 50S ribosomal protein L18 [Candidatus Peribacteria bacterium]|jgi:large subunit ribosomal protein L18|nr:50S ribosomal protein L18 [Candidatus Peribacteria bacterium]